MSALRICRLAIVTIFCVALSGIAPLAQPVWAAPDRGTYVVRSGDTLFSLANRYNTTVAVLQQMNGMGSSNQINAGQTLNMPDSGQSAVPLATQPQSNQPVAQSVTAPAALPGATAGTCSYTVQAGEGLMAIARKLGVPVQELARVNNIGLQTVLPLGRQLRTPCTSATTAAPPAAKTAVTSNTLVAPAVTSNTSVAPSVRTAVPEPGGSRLKVLPTATPEVRPRTY